MLSASNLYIKLIPYKYTQKVLQNL